MALPCPGGLDLADLQGPFQANSFCECLEQPGLVRGILAPSRGWSWLIFEIPSTPTHSVNLERFVDLQAASHLAVQEIPQMDPGNVPQCLPDCIWLQLPALASPSPVILYQCHEKRKPV